MLLASSRAGAALCVVLAAPSLSCQIASAADAPADAVRDAAVTSLRKISVTATRVGTAVDAVPATVSVIDAGQIEDQLVTDIKDLVRFEPGVSVPTSPARFTAAGSSAGRDGNSGFNIRGLEGNRVLILTDGVRVPDAFSFGAQATGRGDYVDMDLLKSVEILRGPASALYGSDGLAGAVSYTTKDPADFLDPGADVGLRTRVAYAGADDSMSEGLAAAARGERWQALLAYTRRDASAQDNQGSNHSADVTRTAPIPQDIASNAALGKLIFTPGDLHRFDLTLDHLDRRVDSDVLSAIALPPLTPTSIVGLSARDDVKRDRISISHAYDGAGALLESVHTTLYYQTSRTREYSAEDRNTAEDRTRYNTFDNDVVGLASQFTTSFDAGASTHQLVYGVDASSTRQEGMRDGTVPPLGESFPTRAFPTTDYVLAGAYVQDAISVLDEAVTLYPAVRFDYYSIDPRTDELFTTVPPQGQHDTHLSPKFGVVWKLAEPVSLYANYGEGFKAPAPSQVNNGFANVIVNYRAIPNPDLEPETSEMIEGGIRWHTGKLSASLSGFSGRYRDFIDQILVSGTFTPTDPGLFQFVNRGRVTIDGAELAIDAQLGSGFTAQAAASYAHGTATTDGIDAPLNSVEPWKLVAGLGWRHASNRFGGLLIATHSAGKDDSRVDAAGCPAPACFTPPSFTILDATAWFQITDALTLRAGVFNLTDEKYWWWNDVRGQAASSGVLDAYTQPGINASVSLTWRL